MVGFTVAQTTAFFEHADQMAIPHATIAFLGTEGIALIDDLAEFDKKSIDDLASNFRRMTNDNGDRVVFGAKSQKRLTVACAAVKFYNMVGREPTAANMAWNPVLKNFETQYNALIEMSHLHTSSGKTRSRLQLFQLLLLTCLILTRRVQLNRR